MKKIIVAGHICLDISPIFNGPETTDIEELIKPGSLLYVDKCDVSTGGVVSNTGLALKSLGADVKLVAKVGNDSFGKIVLEKLATRNAHQDIIVSKGENTSYSIVIAPPGIDRVFLHNSGANDTFCSGDIDDTVFEGVSHLHFGYPPLMKKMYSGSGAHLSVLLKRAKSHGLTTSLDMASIDPNSPAAKIRWDKILENSLPYVDFFMPSFEELCFMLDPKKLETRQFQAEKDNVNISRIVNINDDVKPLAQRCLEMGAKVVVIKCGAPGIYYECSGRRQIRELCNKAGLDIEEWAKKKGFEKSFVPDAVVSGTGCGDTAIAGFLISMLEGKSLKECVTIASGCGAMCVSKMDALSGLITLEELQDKIDSGWEKVKLVN